MFSLCAGIVQRPLCSTFERTSMRHLIEDIQFVMRFRYIIGWVAVVVLSMTLPLAERQHAKAADRPFAPGVLTTIPPDLEADETVSTHDIVEIRANPALQWKPELLADSQTLYGMSSHVKFRRDIWCLAFSFKPLRMISVDVPLPSGKLEKKAIWYMVYSVKNTGQTLVPVRHDDGVYTAELGKGGPVRFIPSFVLESQDRQANGDRIYKAYLDRIIPSAYEAIDAREAHNRPLLNSAQMAAQLIPVSNDRADRSVWGYVTWEQVDPRIDFFSVYVGGLSNAYQWVDPAAARDPNSPPAQDRQFARKTLQLNFWRPGDEFSRDESAIRYGVARGKADLYGVPEGVAYRWVYR
jgi:hypothetical protein